MKEWVVYALLGLAALGLAVGVVSELGGELPCFDEGKAEAVSYLFVQEAESGELMPEEDGTYTLTLADVAPDTLVFADRPVRDAFYVNTREFVAAFDSLFGDDPPNAALSYMSESGEPRTAVFEILLPAILDAGTSVAYRAVPIPVDGGLTEADVRPATFAEASLFIDVITLAPCPPPPLPSPPGCP